MSTSLKEDILNAVAESKCNTCALSHACNNYDEHHCKENGFRRYETINKITPEEKLDKIIKILKLLVQVDNGLNNNMTESLLDMIDELED